MLNNKLMGLSYSSNNGFTWILLVLLKHLHKMVEILLEKLSLVHGNLCKGGGCQTTVGYVVWYLQKNFKYTNSQFYNCLTTAQVV